MVRVDEAFQIILLPSHIHFAALLFFLSGIKRQCIWLKDFELNSIA